MDQSYKKRKGLSSNGKLEMMSLYRATAASKPPALDPTTTFAAAHKPRGSVEFIVKQDQVPKQSVAVVLQDMSASRGYAADYYGGLPVDEAVDVKAATYISTVRERIRLQVHTINS